MAFLNNRTYCSEIDGYLAKFSRGMMSSLRLTKVVRPTLEDRFMSHFTTLSKANSGTAALPASAALAGRALLSAIFILSGISKISAPAGMVAYIESVGLPFPALALVLAILVELAGGVALVLGYRTRLVAAGLAVFSVATALAFHNQLADQNQFIHFFKNLAMAGGLLQVVAFGAGRFSLDARLARA
jgi:putative oxidoreductase